MRPPGSWRASSWRLCGTSATRWPTSATRSRPRPETGETNEMATLTQDEILDAIGNMTLVEVADFIKKFEEKFGVTAAAPVAVAAAPTGAAPAAEGAAPAA